MNMEFLSEAQARKEIIRVMWIVTAQGLVCSSDGFIIYNSTVYNIKRIDVKYCNQ